MFLFLFAAGIDPSRDGPIATIAGSAVAAIIAVIRAGTANKRASRADATSAHWREIEFIVKSLQDENRRKDTEIAVLNSRLDHCEEEKDKLLVKVVRLEVLQEQKGST